MTRNPWTSEGGWSIDCELEAVEIPDQAGRRFSGAGDRAPLCLPHAHPRPAWRTGSANWRDELQAVLEGRP